MTSFTVIPDIHADPSRLARSTRAVHADSKLAFLGDFIDAGSGVDVPDDAAVLQHVRELIDAEQAVAVMGNHELNAILFHRTDRNGAPLRSRESKNARQHRSFCDRFGVGTPDALAWTEWFLTLPLWLDLGDLRLVHACWSQTSIDLIADRRPDGRLHSSDLEEVAGKETPFAKAVNLILTGPEERLPDGYFFHDKGGHRRRDVRIAWWRADAPTWRSAALSVPNPTELPDTAFSAQLGLEFYDDTNPPVLVGHYKMQGVPTLESASAACLDYPDAPCVYRWQGEGQLMSTSLIAL